MPLTKLAIDVPQEGYSFDDGEGVVLRAKVSAGPSRRRLDMLDAPLEGEMTLLLPPIHYQYWRSFYRTTIQRGVLPFLADLVVDDAEVAEYEISMIPGTYRTAVRGSIQIVSFRMEVKLNAPPPVYVDEAIVMLFGLYGERAPFLLNELEQLVNFDIPWTPL